jgi:ribosomal protein S12 methylthiotransferase accessory factor YcaO
VLHCRGHQKGNYAVIQGDGLADEAAKMAAIKEYKEKPTLAAVTISEDLSRL